MPASEYRFFALHQHDEKICGKAWYHEDRHDPGDMSKCYVRLKIKENDLFLEVRMQDGWPEDNDRDLVSIPGVEAGSVANCHADAPEGKDWSEWMIFMFTKR